MARWPRGYSFVARLDGDRRDELIGWMSTTPDVMVALMRADVDVRRLARLPVEQQREELSRIDHVSMNLTSLPETTLGPAAHGIGLRPVITKVASSKPALVDDEDALLTAGVLSALARFGDVTGMVLPTTATPGRTVRTYVVAVPPVTAPTLPDEVRIRFESGNGHAPIGRGSVRVDIHFDDYAPRSLRPGSTSRVVLHVSSLVSIHAAMSLNTGAPGERLPRPNRLDHRR